MNPQRDDSTCEIPAADHELFARRELRGQRRRAVLEHLLRGCPNCRASLADFHDQEQADDSSENEEFLAQTLSLLSERATRYERERAEAYELLASFLVHPVARQWTMLRNSRRYVTFAFGNNLVDAAFEAILDDPYRSLELARMAFKVAESLDAANYTERIVTDLKARSTAHIGNAQRTLGDLRQAAVTLQLAEELRAEGSLDPLLEAELQFLESSLLRGQRKLDAALARVRQAREVYEELGEPRWLCWSLIAEASILKLQGDHDLSLRTLDHAEERCDPEAMPRQALAIQNNRARTLSEAGRPQEALRALSAFRDDYARIGDRTSILRLVWLEANLLEQVGRADAAAAKFEETIQGFADAGLPYEVGSASLEYAQMLSDAGRHDEVARLAGDTLELFRSLGVERETLAAWILFRNGAEAGAVTKALIEKVADYFRRARLGPQNR